MCDIPYNTTAASNIEVNFRAFVFFVGLSVGLDVVGLSVGMEVVIFDDLEYLAGVGDEGVDVVGDAGGDARQNTSSLGTSTQTVSSIQT